MPSPEFLFMLRNKGERTRMLPEWNNHHLRETKVTKRPDGDYDLEVPVLQSFVVETPRRQFVIETPVRYPDPPPAEPPIPIHPLMRAVFNTGKVGDMPKPMFTPPSFSMGGGVFMGDPAAHPLVKPFNDWTEDEVVAHAIREVPETDIDPADYPDGPPGFSKRMVALWFRRAFEWWMSNHTRHVPIGLVGTYPEFGWGCDGHPDFVRSSVHALAAACLLAAGKEVPK